MLKWYEDADRQQDIIVSSRIRLVRNVKGYLFSDKLSREQSEKLVKELKTRIEQAVVDARLSQASGGAAEESPLLARLSDYKNLTGLSLERKKILAERCLLNKSLAVLDSPMGLFCSEDEGMSVLLGGEDHIRIQCQTGGMALHRMWEQINRLDDEINALIPYAFDEKYGYLTTYPTNTGTGLRATVLLHLPALSEGKQFRKYLEEFGRIGISVKGIYGEPSENYGDLYRVSNQKTLGLTEEEIVAAVYRIAGQIAAAERKARRRLLEERRQDIEDQVYKSYGVLKYARKLSEKESLIYLSRIRAGLNDGLIRMERPVSIYGMMIGCGQENVKAAAGNLPGAANEDAMRGADIRKKIPELA